MPAKDGVAPQQGSLFGEILDWMLAPLLLIWPISVALTWLVAQGIASRPYDRELGEMARSLGLQVAAEAPPPGLAKGKDRYALAPEAAALLRADASDTVFYQVLGLRGELLSGDATLPVPTEEAPIVPWELHFRDDEVGSDAVRVAYLWVSPEGQAGSTKVMLVQVAETLGKRARLTNEIIKGVILPLAVLLVWLALARGISPLNELQRRIRSRESSDLSPIDEQRVPDEVAPLVQAINDLLMRLDSSMSRQKHFLADAAHQLKTPLAGLRTQAELVQREIDAGRSSPDELKRSLAQIARASERAAHMVNQLLSMARAEDAEHALRREPVDLAEVAIDTVRDFVPRALERRIDLGYDGVVPDDSRLRVHGHPVLLGELVRNLVDNALLYTPAGGVVTVRVVEDPFGQVVVLQVEDTGPGIPPGEREKVFQPFYRSLGSGVEGSGLGLAIVQEIVQQHDAELALDDTRVRRAAGGESPDGQGPGARFTIRFPATAQAVPLKS
ncbi:sensor histidine kinase [Roseateles puraquae]|uniref:histidine kinase n=1 Tax=Roseateles puraquae TaxID=431059 RepID=A0A254N625_9BURK|nr:sensor histidine kinase [Roseateles puraquae]MDG0857165.1 sensor histidine kinase [Roseateles puraquae]OWR03190.1 sensor histidine kinase [Roseateles puraquae]